MTDQRIAKWTGWIEGDITNEVMTVTHYRQIYERIGEIITDHGELPDSAYWEFLRSTYMISQAVAIRRLVDTHRGTASLRNLIAEISADAAQNQPPRLTRDFWVGLWGSDPADVAFAERQWNENYGGEVGDHLDPAIPAEDLARLTTLTDPIKEYVEKHVCHIDRRRPEPTVTLNDLHRASVVLGDTFTKYASLLTAKGWISLTPMIQHDWEAIFRQPWIRHSPRRG